MSRAKRVVRRTSAAVVAVLVVAALSGGVAASQQAGESYVIEQGDACTEIDPLSYENQSVVEFYGYTANASDEGVVYSANTPLGLEDVNDRTSSLFLYEGPDGLSLVVLHGAPDGSAGGAASFQFDGLPEDGQWVVKDDPESESVEQWNRTENGAQTVHWAWQSRYTDGGAFHGGLGGEFEVRIDAAFGEDARLDPLSQGNASEWRALSANGDTLESISLDANQPLTVRSGTCESGSA